MERCLQLAEKGLGHTGSNPLVGCVIVHNNTIIGEGFHHEFGGPHAEVLAIQSVTNKALLRVSTLYVNLEPCAHSGKTPPCTDLIRGNNIPHLVIGMVDPNALVKGKGIEKLKQSGCRMDVGILEDKCRFLNRRFITFHQKKRPYVILKWAESADGFIDVHRKAGDPVGPNWISGPKERMMVHKWRSQEPSILAGTKTLITDNPRLDTREWTGPSPLKLVIDRTLKLPPGLQVFNKGAPCIVFTEKENRNIPGTSYVKIDFQTSIWPQILDFLYNENIVSVLVEGGSFTINSLISEGFWDEARIFTGTPSFKRGKPAPELPESEGLSVQTWQTGLNIHFNGY